jgi:hypothetical protein
MADDDEPTNLSDERRRRKPLSEFEKALAVIEGVRAGAPLSEDSQKASDFLRGVDIGEKSTEKRFELAMLEINLDFFARHKIQAAYDALKNKRA